MKGVELSFIVPVYNGEMFVQNCIDSLYQQKLPEDEFEIIVVNDCSTDGTKQILKEIQKLHSNLSIVNQSSNSKLGSARNAGLKKANGKYIWFVDSDDWIEDNCTKSLLYILEEQNLDFVHFDYKTYDEVQKVLLPYRINYTMETTDGMTFCMDSHELWWQKGVEAWRKIYRKDFLLLNNLYFADGVMYEDVDYSFKLFWLTKKMLHIDASPYIYRRNNNSITNQEISSFHLYYWISSAIRCSLLLKREQFPIFYKNNVIDYIKYQVNKVFGNLKIMSKEQVKEYKSLITRSQLLALFPYISISKMIKILIVWKIFP